MMWQDLKNEKILLKKIKYLCKLIYGISWRTGIFPEILLYSLFKILLHLPTTFLNCNELGTLGIYFYAFHQNLLLRENEQKCYEALPKIESFDKLRLLGLQSHPHIVILGIYLNLIQSFQKETSKGWIQLTLFTIYSLNNISLILAVNSKSCSKKNFCRFDQLLSN